MTPLARTTRVELLDQLDAAPADVLAGNLRDIRRANRWLGGTRTVLSAIMPLLGERARHGQVTILDLATGSADIPLALAERASREGWDLRIIATDLQPEVLAVARAAVRDARIAVERADALNLPYEDESFDIVTLSQALHHFEPADAARVLREMGRVGRHGLVVCDLERSRLGYGGAWLFGVALTRNPMTRNDAPLSVRRAYTLPEALALARAAGWRDTRIRRALPFRYALTGRPA